MSDQEQGQSGQPTEAEPAMGGTPPTWSDDEPDTSGGPRDDPTAGGAEDPSNGVANGSVNSDRGAQDRRSSSLGVGLPFTRRRSTDAAIRGTDRGSEYGGPAYDSTSSYPSGWSDPPASPPARRRGDAAGTTAEGVAEASSPRPGGSAGTGVAVPAGGDGAGRAGREAAPESPPLGPRHGRAQDSAGSGPVAASQAGSADAQADSSLQGRHQATHNPRRPDPSMVFEDDDLFETLEPRPVPRTGPRALLYRATRINLGPGKKDRAEQEIRQRLNRQLLRTRGYCGYIAIASEKGGVGKTTLAALLATELSEGRRESVGVADLNPDLGTLPDRYGIRPRYSIRDLLAHVDEIPWRYHVHDFMDKVPEMNVRVLAASTDRKIRHQLAVEEVELLAELFAPFFSFAILDNGTHITHAAMLGALQVSHGLVLVTDNTKDGANLARKTLQFLTDNGYPDMRQRVVLAIVAKEVASPIKTRAIERAFRDHVRELVTIPYDPALDGGGRIPFQDPNAVNKLVRPNTRAAVRRLAAIAIDDLVE